MKTALAIGSLLLSLFLLGCKGESPSPAPQPNVKGEDANVSANLAKLGAEDRKLAEAQKLCPVTEEPLGSMGVPPKITVEGQLVFLCCKSCEKKARTNAAQTLAKVKEFKAKAPAK
jgi:hypothetical protein